MLLALPPTWTAPVPETDADPQLRVPLYNPQVVYPWGVPQPRPPVLRPSNTPTTAPPNLSGYPPVIFHPGYPIGLPANPVQPSNNGKPATPAKPVNPVKPDQPAQTEHPAIPGKPANTPTKPGEDKETMPSVISPLRPGYYPVHGLGNQLVPSVIISPAGGQNLLYPHYHQSNGYYPFGYHG